METVKLQILAVFCREIPYSLAVMIPGFHPGGPGSTPGMGTFFFSALLLSLSLQLVHIYWYFVLQSYI